MQSSDDPTCWLHELWQHLVCSVNRTYGVYAADVDKIHTSPGSTTTLCHTLYMLTVFVL